MLLTNRILKHSSSGSMVKVGKEVTEITSSRTPGKKKKKKPLSLYIQIEMLALIYGY